MNGLIKDLFSGVLGAAALLNVACGATPTPEIIIREVVVTATPKPVATKAIEVERKETLENYGEPTQIPESTNTPMSAPEEIHIVQPNDTLDNIAGKYGVTVEDLKEWNNIKNDFIYWGQKLYIEKPGTPIPIGVTPSVTQVTPVPYLTYRKLENFVDEISRYYLMTKVVMPQRGQEIVDWGVNNLHFDELDTLVCLSDPRFADNWNWDETRNCLNQILNELDQLESKVGHSLYIDDARVAVNEFLQIAKFEDPSLYGRKLNSFIGVLNYVGGAYYDVPDKLVASVPPPNLLVSGYQRQYITKYYVFTDGHQISTYEDLFDHNARVFTQFFVQEHDHAERILTMQEEELNDIGIFEYETPAEAEEALNRLYSAVNVDDQTYDVGGVDYNMIFWKDPAHTYDINMYAFVKRADRFVIISDPDNNLKINDTFITRTYVTPLLK